MRQITAIIFHNTDSPQATTTLEMVREWHVKGNGWKDIGYHKFVDGQAVCHQGRPDEEVGAHALNHNAHTIGVAAAGNGNKEHLTPAMKHTLVQVFATLCKRHGLTERNILGHREVNATACPGDLYFQDLQEIKKEVAHYLKH